MTLDGAVVEDGLLEAFRNPGTVHELLIAVRDAVQHGDLNLPDGTSVIQVGNAGARSRLLALSNGWSRPNGLLSSA